MVLHGNVTVVIGMFLRCCTHGRQSWYSVVDIFWDGSMVRYEPWFLCLCHTGIVRDCIDRYRAFHFMVVAIHRIGLDQSIVLYFGQCGVIGMSEQ